MTVGQAWISPLAAWDVSAAWPREGVLSRVVFLLALTAGLAAQSAAILLAPRRPTTAVTVAFGCYAALVLVLDSPAWLDAASLPVAATVFFLAVNTRLGRMIATFVALLTAFLALQWLWVTRMSGAPSAQWAFWMLKEALGFVPLMIAAMALGGVWAHLSRKEQQARAEAEAARREHEKR
ncbi:MAG: hypothetical protein FWF28_02460, partial [Micrococcales bacterium]|nr:hypothetical protein [Micrococcales bacterium]